jgi:2-dehydro-3-deoxygluconokinase
VPNTDDSYAELDTKSFRSMISEVVAAFPNITTIATSLRTAKSATVNGWGGILYHQGEFFEVAQRELEIMDRVGGGDSFASGIIYGLLAGKGPQFALECGVAHGALAMSTPGDTTSASLEEVRRAMAGASARIER